MRPTWPKIASLLAGLWIVVGGVMWWVKASRPTADKIASYATAHPLDGRSAAKRTEVVEAIAAQVNKLEEEERRELRQKRRLEPFWLAMTPEERTHYLDLILPTDFKLMMENFNKLEPLKRRRMVEKAVKELRERGGEEMPQELTDAQMRKVVDEGLKAFYSDATIEAKMDALPFIEELEKSIQWSR